MPFILLLGFLGDCFELYVHTNVHLQLNTLVRLSVPPSRSSNLQQAGHYWRLNHWVRRCWVWCVPCWVEVCLAVWLQEETLQTKTSWTLESDSDACSSEGDISAESDTDTDSDTGDTTDTTFTQWTVDTNCPTVPVVL